MTNDEFDILKVIRILYKAGKTAILESNKKAH